VDADQRRRVDEALTAATAGISTAVEHGALVPGDTDTPR
jgi:hypothetical protein